jgi:hypothetical protein
MLPDTSLSFLGLPLELRLEIYLYLLLLGPIPNRLALVGAAPKLYVSILQTNRQIHDEATPVLYGQNTFVAHSSMLASFPSLRQWYAPVKEVTVLSLIKKFHLRVRLDCDLAYDEAAVTEAFSGKEELTIEVWQPVYLGVGRDNLRRFEGVRGVKRAKVFGSVSGFRDYARWLEAGIMSSVSCEVTPFVEVSIADERC